MTGTSDVKAKWYVKVSGIEPSRTESGLIVQGPPQLVQICSVGCAASCLAASRLAWVEVSTEDRWSTLDLQFELSRCHRKPSATTAMRKPPQTASQFDLVRWASGCRRGPPAGPAGIEPKFSPSGGRTCSGTFVDFGGFIRSAELRLGAPTPSATESASCLGVSKGSATTAGG